LRETYSAFVASCAVASGTSAASAAFDPCDPLEATVQAAASGPAGADGCPVAAVGTDASAPFAFVDEPIVRETFVASGDPSEIALASVASFAASEVVAVVASEVAAVA